MKIRSLLLGSVAAAGLSTGGAFAADLGVLPSFDICDELGLSGLTISSETNCLVVSGEVSYDFTWSSYPEEGSEDPVNDWTNDLNAWIKFASSSSTDFGKATAVITIEGDYEDTWEVVPDHSHSGGDSWETFLSEAYVSIGDGTVFTAGLTDSIGNYDDDDQLTWIEGFLFGDDDLDAAEYGGGLSFQVSHDLGNGFSVAAGLENLDGFGTAIGVLQYAGDDISAHVTVEATDVLLGDADETDWAVHAGFTGTFDAFKTVLAGSYFGYADDDTEYNVLASASYDFDMFTLAATVEAEGYDDASSAYEYSAVAVAGSVSAEVTDGVTLNLGGRWASYDYTSMADWDSDEWEVAVGVTADVTETLEVSAKLGYSAWDYEPASPILDGDVVYGELGLTWNPDGDDGYEASITGKANSDSVYSVETSVSKTFE